MGIKTRMYIGYGSSLRSEKDAFKNASCMVRQTGIDIQSIRLDKYFSNQADIEYCKDKMSCSKVFFIPKSDVTVRGSKEWKDSLLQFVQNTNIYLENYFQRNNSESAFAEDKRRTGWNLGQKRQDRIMTANKLTSLWHNLYWLG